MRRWLPYALVALALAAYANSFRGPFLFDDLPSIPDNPSIRQLWPLSIPLSPPPLGESVAGRPLVNLSYALDYAIGGFDVSMFHVTNLAIHIACGLLLFAITHRTLNDEAVAFASALIWVVHPLQTESVTYLAARTESMMALCLLLTLYAAMRGWTVAAVAACAAGMACKESMVVAPLLVPLYDRAFTYSSWRRAWNARRTLWLGLAATWVVLLVILWSWPRAHSAGFDSGGWTYLLNQAPLIIRYLRLVVWPTGFVFDYGYPRAVGFAEVAAPFFVITALLVATAIAVVRWPRVGFLGAWFFLTLAPASSIFPIVTEVGAERRMYVPSMAICVLLVALVTPLLRRRPAIAVGTLALAVGVCVALTLARNREYQSPLTMWAVTVERWPRGRARQNYAAALQAAGRRDEMTAQLRLAVADYPESRYELGAQLLTRGETDEGLANLDQFVREFPTHPNARAARDLITRTRTRLAAQATDRGIAHATAGRPDEAIREFRRAADLLPDNANVHRNLANALLDVRDYVGAAAEARQALRLNPTDPLSKEILADASRR